MLCLVAQSCLSLWDLWTVAHQAPLSMGFSRPEYWSGLPCPPPGDLPHTGIEPGFPASQADSLLSELSGKPCFQQRLYALNLSMPVFALCSCVYRLCGHSPETQLPKDASPRGAARLQADPSCLRPQLPPPLHRGRGRPPGHISGLPAPGGRRRGRSRRKEPPSSHCSAREKAAGGQAVQRC